VRMPGSTPWRSGGTGGPDLDRVGRSDVARQHHTVELGDLAPGEAVGAAGKGAFERAPGAINPQLGRRFGLAVFGSAPREHQQHRRNDRPEVILQDIFLSPAGTRRGPIRPLPSVFNGPVPGAGQPLTVLVAGKQPLGVVGQPMLVAGCCPRITPRFAPFHTRALLKSQPSCAFRPGIPLSLGDALRSLRGN